MIQLITDLQFNETCSPPPHHIYNKKSPDLLHNNDTAEFFRYVEEKNSILKPINEEFLYTCIASFRNVIVVTLSTKLHIIFITPRDNPHRRVEHDKSVASALHLEDVDEHDEPRRRTRTSCGRPNQ
jgi:hypothetical protein